VAYFGVGAAADDSSTGQWSVATSSTDEVDRRAAAWGLADLPNKGGCTRVPLELHQRHRRMRQWGITGDATTSS
jgi:hypothetical protein